MTDHESLIPRMAGALEEDRLRAMPLAAVDRFVLSLVDGTTSVQVLAETVGLTSEDVIASLLKLEALGVVSLPHGSGPPSASAGSPPLRSVRAASPPRPPPLPQGYAQPTPVQPAPPAAPSPAPPRAAPTPPVTTQQRSAPGTPAAARPPPASAFAPERPTQTSAEVPPERPNHATPSVPADQSGGAIEIDLDHQREIDAKFGLLDSVDHYVLLGLERGADRKAIKRAYFALTARFHPDRFFRKRLGTFKTKMEAVFGRMTEAHDTLTANDRRAEYDAYLGSVEKTRSIEQMLSDAVSEMKRAEEAAIGVAVALSSVPPPPTSRSPESSTTPPSATTPNLGAFIADALDGRGPSKPPTSAARISVQAPARSEAPAQARRELLARRLTGGTRIPSAPKVPSIGYVKTGDAVDALKRRYEEKVSAARTSQAKKYSDAGYAARAKGDMVAAANSLRVALSFDNENQELKAAHDEAQKAADQILVEQYLKQAEYEERSERWSDAGRSWSRVARAQVTNAKAHERAGHCLMKADGDLHEAVALAQRAVQLEPKNVAYRRTMANVYLAAGLTLNAKRELDALLQLAPEDAAAITLLKRIAKSS